MLYITDFQIALYQALQFMEEHLYLLATTDADATEMEVIYNTQF